MQSNDKNEQGSGAANAIVMIAKALLTVFLFCVMVGGGVCGICIGVMELKHNSASSDGAGLIFFTLLGIAVIGFVLWLMWGRKKPVPPERNP